MNVKKLVILICGITLSMGTTYAAIDNKENSTPLENIDRTEWVVTASNSGGNQGPDKAVDEDENSRWTLGKSQEAGDWFMIDMQSPQKFDSIELQQGRSISDYPEKYEVYVSNDGKNWGKALVKGSGQRGAATVITLPTTTEGRFIKIVQTSDRSTWWSIHELIIKKK